MTTLTPRILLSLTTSTQNLTSASPSLPKTLNLIPNHLHADFTSLLIPISIQTHTNFPSCPKPSKPPKPYTFNPVINLKILEPLCPTRVPSYKSPPSSPHSTQDGRRGRCCGERCTALVPPLIPPLLLPPLNRVLSFVFLAIFVAHGSKSP